MYPSLFHQSRLWVFPSISNYKQWCTLFICIFVALQVYLQGNFRCGQKVKSFVVLLDTVKFPREMGHPPSKVWEWLCQENVLSSSVIFTKSNHWEMVCQYSYNLHFSYYVWSSLSFHMLKGHLKICICELYMILLIFLLAFWTYFSQFQSSLCIWDRYHPLPLIPVSHSYFKIIVNLWDYFIVLK